MASNRMIETLKDAIPLGDASMLFPGNPHPTTVHRWATRGAHGVILQTWLVGGKRFTTPSAIEKFLLALNTDSDGENSE